MINVNHRIKIKQPNPPQNNLWLEQIAAVAETAHINRNRAAAEIIANLLYDLVDGFQTELHDEPPKSYSCLYGNRTMKLPASTVTQVFE